MKKLILVLLSANILITNTTQILSCSEISDKRINKSENEDANDSHKKGNHKNGNNKKGNHKKSNNKNDNHKDNNHKDDNHKNDNNDPSKNETTSAIIDLNSSYNPIHTSRGWNGTLFEESSIDKFLRTKNSDYSSFTNEQIEFIKKLTMALHSSASKKANKKFDNFLKQKTFSTFDDLVVAINTHNKNASINSYIDVPLELMRNHATDRAAFEDTLLKIYNTASSFFGKDYGYKILRTLAMSRQKPGENSLVLGVTSYWPGPAPNYNAIAMRVDETILSQNRSKKEYDSGWFTTPHIYGTFVHEFGHVIDFFHESEYPLHETIDNYSGLVNEYSIDSIAHNEYKKNYCQKLVPVNEPCPYKLSQNYVKNASAPVKFSNKINTAAFEQVNYSISQTTALTELILSKIKNLKAPGKNFDEQQHFIKDMLLKIFINSDYGRSLIHEVHSEGFTYWLLTPENERDKTWEIWNEFFLEYLPDLRNKTSHFNDYLKTET